MFNRMAVAGLVSAFALMVIASDAMAQTADSSSTSSSGAAANSGSRSSSQSGVVRSNQNQTTSQGNVRSTNTTGVGVTINNGTGGGNGANGTNATDPAGANGLNGHGGTGGLNGGGNGAYGSTAFSQQNGDVTVRTTPTVYAPPVSGGNPCTLAVSGGVSVIGWGAAAGGTFVDQDCADRQKIAMIWNAGYKGAAKELMCNDQKTYNAFKTAGEPCAVRPQWEAPGAPRMAEQQPGPVMITPAASPPGRYACMDARGREVAVGTPGASCGQI